jgi:hypothetical protein
MKTIQLLCITTCLTVVFCANSYSQANKEFKKVQTTQQEKKKETVVFTPPVIIENVMQLNYGDEEAVSYGYANLGVMNEQFVQKTFTTALHDDQIAVESSRISPRASFKNLEVYLIYAHAYTDQKKYVALHNALKNNLVKIDETSTVGKLSVSNNSDQYVYINSGDIVKGGKQDRTIKYDIVIAPHAQNIDLASFCVEHNRWSQRGSETANNFTSSEKSLSSSDLKVAARHNSNQSEVWHEVKDYQVTTNANLNTDAQYMQTIQHKSNTVARDANATQNINVGNVPVSNVVVADVTNNESSSSLELTLENKDLNKINEEYKKTIVEQLGNREGAVGIAYYINGKLYSIDVYNNHQLFTDLFDKLLDAAIAEAISVKSNGQDPMQGDIQLVKDLLKADAKVYVEENINKITQATTSENNINKDMWIFSTVDLEEKTWLHRNWIIK